MIAIAILNSYREINAHVEISEHRPTPVTKRQYICTHTRKYVVRVAPFKMESISLE